MTDLKLIHDITQVCYHPLPAEWVAEVTPEDEEEGRLGSCIFCPIALASARALQIPAGIIDVTGHAHIPLRMPKDQEKKWPSWASDSPSGTWVAEEFPHLTSAFRFIELFDSDEMSRWPKDAPKRFTYRMYKTFQGEYLNVY